MRIKPNPRLIVSLLLLAVAGIVSSTLAVSTPKVFTGQYDWRDGGTGDLSAEFKPDGDNQWRVTFRFDFDGSSKTWKGKAEGNLEDGSEVTGTASWKSRDWGWTATIEEGTMRGKHTELKSRGRTYDTGTFELNRTTSERSTR